MCILLIVRSIPLRQLHITEKRFCTFHCAVLLNSFFSHRHYSKNITGLRIKQRKEASPCLLAFLVSAIYHLTQLHHELQMIHTVTTTKDLKKLFSVEQQYHLWGNDTKNRKQFITQRHVDQSSARWQIIYFGSVQNSGEFWKLFITVGMRTYQTWAMCSNNNVLGPTSWPF